MEVPESSRRGLWLCVELSVFPGGRRLRLHLQVSGITAAPRTQRGETRGAAAAPGTPQGNHRLLLCPLSTPRPCALRLGCAKCSAGAQHPVHAPQTENVHHTRARHEDFASQSDSRPFAGMDSHRKRLDKGSFFKGDVIWKPERTRHKQQSPKRLWGVMRKAMTFETLKPQTCV